MILMSYWLRKLDHITSSRDNTADTWCEPPYPPAIRLNGPQTTSWEAFGCALKVNGIEVRQPGILS